MKFVLKVCLAGFLLAFYSCSNSFTQSEYFAFLNNAENGFLIRKEIGNKEVQGKFLPADFMLLKDLSKGFNSSNKDSIRNLYANSRTFLFTISNTEENSKALVYDEIADYKAYQERAYTLNFDMKEFFSLQTKGGNYKPVLVTAENTYGLQKSLNIIVVFARKDQSDDLMTSEEYDLVFNDEVFDTGISHFVFYKSNIDKEVTLKIES